MKTTIDLPDELLRRAKITTAKRNAMVKALVVKGLEYATQNDISDAASERKQRASRLIEALAGVSITESFGKFHHDEIYDRRKGRPE
jgi:hypothetical protein